MKLTVCKEASDPQNDNDNDLQPQISPGEPHKRG